MRLDRRLFALLLVAACAIAAGCSSTPEPVRLVADPALLARSQLVFLRAGESTREEVLFRLGTPSARFENDRIITYQVGFEENGAAHVFAPRLFATQSWAVRDWQPGTFSLVLVFGGDGVLSRYNLVSSE